MARSKFSAILERPNGPGTWTYLAVPLDIAAAYGTRGQLKVKATIQGVEFRSSLFPRGDGTHYLVVNKQVRDASGVSRGDRVTVALEPDLEERTLSMPAALRRSLSRDSEARKAYDVLSYSHRKEYVDYVAGAKRAETVLRRVDRTLEMLKAGRKLKG